jgi:hypothetical protein
MLQVLVGSGRTIVIDWLGLLRRVIRGKVGAGGLIARLLGIIVVVVVGGVVGIVVLLLVSHGSDVFGTRSGDKG